MKKQLDWIKITGIIMLIVGCITLLGSISSGLVLISLVLAQTSVLPLVVVLTLVGFPFLYSLASIATGVFFVSQPSKKAWKWAVFVQLFYVITFNSSLITLVGQPFLAAKSYIGVSLLPLIIFVLLLSVRKKMNAIT